MIFVIHSLIIMIHQDFIILVLLLFDYLMLLNLLYFINCFYPFLISNFYVFVGVICLWW